MLDKYENAMRSALEVAHEALASDDVPVGAIILDEHGNQVASGFNRREVDHDPTAHALSLIHI